MRYLVLIVSFCLCSCFRPSIPPKAEELKPPVEVEIPQSFVTDGKLHVKVSLKPLVNLKANQVAVDLIGVDHGQEVVKKSLALNALVSEPILKANVPLVTDFEMDASGFDEYKVVCRWSEEGVGPVAAVESPKSTEASGKFELLEQTLVRSDCEKKGDICERKYRIQAQLRNSTSAEISEISLALEIKFIPKGEALQATDTPDLSPLTAEEQEVKLEGLKLAPNAKRPIEVKIPEALVEIPDGMFVPKIRIYSYK
jgi:hypothetical protein